MANQLTLPVCVLPGCATTVGEWGDVCAGCQTSFGAMLQPGNRLSEDEIRDRDEQVQAAYAMRKGMVRA